MADAIYTETKVEFGPIGRVLDAIARAFAICSGLVLTGMAILSFASIIGRALFSSPLLGDYEVVQMMSAVAVAMALPFCHMTRGHVIVDFFTTGFSPQVNRHLDLIANLLLLVAAVAFTWRMAVGMAELQRSGDASMLLNLPTWLAYVPMVASFALLACTALYAAWEDFTGDLK